MDISLKIHRYKAGALGGTVSEVWNPYAESSQERNISENVDVGEQQKGKVLGPDPPPPMPPLRAKEQKD